MQPSKADCVDPNLPNNMHLGGTSFYMTMVVMTFHHVQGRGPNSCAYLFVSALSIDNDRGDTAVDANDLRRTVQGC